MLSLTGMIIARAESSAEENYESISIRKKNRGII